MVNLIMVYTLINIKYYQKLLIAFLIFLSISSVLSQSIRSNQQKPNVILILIDDLKPNLGIYGDDFSKSPNIDQLAREGIRFNLAFANQAVCVASRYNLMLGKRSTSTGLYRFGVNFREIYPAMETLLKFLKTMAITLNRLEKSIMLATEKYKMIKNPGVFHITMIKLLSTLFQRVIIESLQEKKHCLRITTCMQKKKLILNPSKGRCMGIA